MPTITTKINDSVSDPSYGQTGNSAQQKAKWLYELERAQWQARAHYQPAPPDNNAGKSKLSDEVASETKKRSNLVGEAPIFQTPAEQTPSFQAPIEPTQAAQAVPTTFNEIVKNTVFQLAAFQAPIQLQRLSPGEYPALAQDPISADTRTAEQTQWAKQNIHLVKNNGEINLWLRDARFATSDGLGLYSSLQKRFADLGQKLVQLTINGRPVNLDQIVPSNTSTQQGE